MISLFLGAFTMYDIVSTYGLDISTIGWSSKRKSSGKMTG